MKESRKRKIEREREQRERGRERERKRLRTRIRETDRDRERKRDRESLPIVPFSNSAVVSLTLRQSRHLFLCIGAQKLLPLHFSQTLLCHWCSQTLLPPESVRFLLIRWCARTVLPHQLSLHSFSCSCAAGARRGCCAFAVHETAAGPFGPPWHRQPTHVPVR